MYYVRSEEGFPEYSVDQLANYILRIRERFPAEVTFLARRAGNLVGWISIHRSSETIGEVDRWHPFVNPDEDQSIGKELIERSNEYSKNHGITRLTCTFSNLTGNLEDAYQTREKWYEAAGWSMMNTDVYMVWDAKQEEVPEFTLDEGYTFESMVENSQDDLYRCYEDAFLAGEDQEIHDMTPEQRRERFQNHYDRELLIEQSSVVAMKRSEIAGFVMVKDRENEHHVDLIAVRANHRRKGLAKALLGKVMEIAASRKVEVVTVGVDLGNKSAIQLYKKMRLKVDSKSITYSWNA